VRLSAKRSNFSTSLARLILYINSLGYHVAVDYVKRCRNCKVGKKNSCHKSGLAADLNLYDAYWSYLDGRHPDTQHIHDLAHDFWDKQGGARRISRDMNHYSFAHLGMR
jgi:hypothetical protein